jgi:hypothetical protein
MSVLFSIIGRQFAEDRMNKCHEDVVHMELQLQDLDFVV